MTGRSVQAGAGGLPFNEVSKGTAGAWQGVPVAGLRSGAWVPAVTEHAGTHHTGLIISNTVGRIRAEFATRRLCCLAPPRPAPLRPAPASIGAYSTCLCLVLGREPERAGWVPD